MQKTLPNIKESSVSRLKVHHQGSRDLPTLVMLHGFRNNHKSMLPLADKLDKTFHVVIPDLPGFGASDPLHDEQDLDDLALWLNDFLLGLKGEYLVYATSFSAAVLMRILDFTSQPKIKGIILSSPALHFKTLPAKIGWWYYLLAHNLPDNVAKKYYGKAPTVLGVNFSIKTRNKKLRRWLLDQDIDRLKELRPRIVTNAMRSYLKAKYTLDPENVIIPTLLMRGKKDPVTSKGTKKYIVALFSSTTVYEHPKAGHILYGEEPDWVVEGVLNWYKETYANK